VSATPIAEGITNPPIDELLTKTDSKYRLVLYAAKRARQINAYYSQLGEGLLEYVGPLVDTHVQEKPLSIALREINEDLLTHTEFDPEAEAAAVPAGDGIPASDFAVDFGLTVDDQDVDGAGPDGAPAP
jgi:DNA-directed RNA polymerase subunit omega